MVELAPNQAWPIAPWGIAYDRWRENDAWWVGDTDQLEQLYAAGVGRPTHRVRGVDHEGGLVGAAHALFWGRPVPANEHRTRLHIPAAADVATLSSDSLFAESPSIEYPDDARVSKDTRTRLARIMGSEQSRAAIAEGGELVSAFGATAMRLAWDDSRDSVWFEPIGADVTIPEFRAGRLVALNAFTEYRGAGSIIYRHIERHEAGRIIHTLYQGTAENLGTIVPLTEIPQTRALAEIPGLTDNGIETGISRLTATWWINAPARAWRRRGDLAEAGRSDYSGGVIGLFDALDQTWSSWMRDVKLARARLLVDSQMLDSGGVSGSGASFDADREIFQALDVVGMPDKPFVQHEQFEIRAEAHAATAQALYLRILAATGQGELDKETTGVDRTATEIRVGTSSRERTRDRKSLYATQALADLAQTAMMLDGAKYPGQGGGDYGPLEIEFPPASQQDPETIARTVAQLRAARTLSLETAIRMQNPTWRKAQIDEELERLRAEDPAASDPTRVGSPLTDPAAAERARRQLGLPDPNALETDDE